MGLSHTLLALLSATMFISILFAIALTNIYSVQQTSNTPRLRVCTEAFVDPDLGVSTIVLRIIHEYGRPVSLLYVEFEQIGRLYLKDLDSIGCSETIKRGDICTLKYTFKGYLTVGKTYSGVAVFTEGSYPLSFTPTFTYKPVKKNAPVYNVTIVDFNIWNSSANSTNLIVNSSYIASEGAIPIVFQNGTGVVVIDLLNNTFFSGLGFVFNNNTNLESNFTTGSWLITVFKLVNNSNTFPLRWGIGIFFDHKMPTHPEEQVVFVGILVNSTGSYLVIETYDRYQGLDRVVSAVKLNTTLDKVFREPLILATYVAMGKNPNFYCINSTLYDLNLTNLGSTVDSCSVRLPGTPGQWYLRPALVVNNTIVYYENLLLTNNFTTPLIVVSNVPADYILEVYISNLLVYRAASRGAPIGLPYTWLPSGTTFVVRYPRSVGEPVAYRFVLPFNVGPYTEIALSTRLFEITTIQSGEAATVLVELPVGNESTNVTGVIVSDLVNKNAYAVKLRLSILTDLSIIGNLTLIIDVLDRNGRSILGQPLIIDKGVVHTSTTSWTPTLIKPGESPYLYIIGYYNNGKESSRIVLEVETLIQDPDTMEILHIERRPIILHAYAR